MLRLVEQNHLLTWPDEANSHLGARHHSTSSMECEIKGISHHVFASHEQTCIGLEKASQFITEALQNAVQRNMALRMLTQRLEDRASENGRCLSEQMESNRQLKLQVEDLQKHLEDKDNSLTQANQTIAILNNELGDLQQQLLNHQSSDRTIQEVTEWLEDGKNQADAVKKEDAPVQTIVVGIKEEEEDPAEVYAAADEYQTSQPDGTFTEQTTYSSGDIKIRLVQEAHEESGVAPGPSDHPSPPPPPLVSSAPHQPSSPPLALLRLRGLSVDVVDCRTTQGQQGTRSKHNQDGEQSKTGRGRRGRGGGVARGRGMQLFSTEIPKTTANPVTMLNAGRGGRARGMQLSLLEIPKPTANPQAMVDIVEQHRCSVCGESFSARRDLKVHQQMHKEKPKTFTENGSLNKRRGVHTSERPYLCKECGKCFSTLQVLNTHSIVHTGERNFPCKQCGMRFSQGGSLKRHQLIHMGVKPYPCSQCGKRFARAAGLERHRRIHTGERPYQCGQCGRAFSFVESMTRHQRLHTRDKPKYN